MVSAQKLFDIPIGKTSQPTKSDLLNPFFFFIGYNNTRKYKREQMSDFNASKLGQIQFLNWELCVRLVSTKFEWIDF